MPVTVHPIPLNRSTLEAVAEVVLQNCPGAETGDLTAALVLLPAQRAVESLKHVLLEVSGREALLLPEIATPTRLVARLAGAFGLEPVEDDLRATLLAPRLRGLDWAGGPAARGDARTGSAAGLAEELVTLLDDLRKYGRLDRLVGDGDEDLAWIAPAEAEVFARDRSRVREAWRRYRAVVPRGDDGIDQLVAVTGRLESDGWPGPAPRLVVAADFSPRSLDPLAGCLVSQLLAMAGGHFLVPDLGTPIARRMLATYAASDPELRPDATRRGVLVALDLGATAETAGDAAAPSLLVDRLAALTPAGSPPAILSCADPEQEAATVAAAVIEGLQESDGRDLRIGVATPDRQLAVRIIAHLRDAGVDVDDSGGAPLASFPAGVLAHAIVQAVRTGLRPAELIEVLTHPYVQVGRASAHATWTLRLEREIRGRAGGVPTLAALEQRARQYDENAARLAARSPRDGGSESVSDGMDGIDALDAATAGDRGGMSGFVAAIVAAFAPLIEFTAAPSRATADRDERDAVDWGEGFAAVWSVLAPDSPLHDEAEDEDRAALAKLLARLATVADRLPVQHFGAWAGELLRLVRRETVRRHRELFLPVQVTGLLEARLETFDRLMLAGLADDVFPGSGGRPLFLNDRARRALDLPGWRERRSEEAELFLRLLHAAGSVLLTFPRERQGQPVLPSSLITRLELAGIASNTETPPASVYRRAAPPIAAIDAREEAFRAEPEPAYLTAVLPPIDHLSYSQLATFGQCPYRWLLERRFGLRREEDVVAAFRRQDYGTQVHAAMSEFLTPQGEGWRALEKSDAEAARRVLAEIAAAKIGGGAGDLPQRHLWLRSFLDVVPEVVACELARWRAWRPRALEVDFRLPLAQLHAWATGVASELNEEPGLPTLRDLPPGAAEVPLEGRIDRVDLAVEGAVDGVARAAVLDYKTGQRPGPRAVALQSDLQVVLYTVAVETGALRRDENADPDDALIGATPPAPLPGATGVTEASYYGLRPGETGPPERGPHVNAREPEGRRILLAGARVLVDLVARAIAADAEFPLVPDYFAGVGQGPPPCQYCAFLGICRLEERVLPPRLAGSIHPRPETTGGG